MHVDRALEHARAADEARVAAEAKRDEATEGRDKARQGTSPRSSTANTWPRSSFRTSPRPAAWATRRGRPGHRRSTDIDVTLPGNRNMSDLMRDDEHNLARRIGGKAAHQDDDEIKVICAEGALHLARLKPHAAGAEAVALVNGQRETVLANTQILRGKLARAHNSPVRDVFDIICAAKADRRGLAAAAGTLNAQQAERIATRWRTANTDFADEAATELKDVAPNFETPRDTLGSDAADALENHRYRRLEVEVDRDEVVIRKTIASGALPDERYPLAEARAALSASGIEEHLDANGSVMPINRRPPSRRWPSTDKRACCTTAADRRQQTRSRSRTSTSSQAGSRLRKRSQWPVTTRASGRPSGRRQRYRPRPKTDINEHGHKGPSLVATSGTTAAGQTMPDRRKEAIPRE